MKRKATTTGLSSFFVIAIVLFTLVTAEPFIAQSVAESNTEARNQDAPTSQAEYKAIVRRFYAAIFDTGDLTAADEFITPDYIDHNPIEPGLTPGVEGVGHISTLFRTGFPDINVAVEDLIVEKDKVVSRITVRGTHKDEFMGVEPTGKRIEITGIEIYRIVDGKISARWGNLDNMALMQQLGVIQQQNANSAGQLSQAGKQPADETQWNADDLTNLDDWETLNAVFQRDIGRVRIVALLSPN